MDDAALAVSPQHREKDEPEAAEHRVVEELCCAVPRGDEAWSSSAGHWRVWPYAGGAGKKTPSHH